MFNLQRILNILKILMMVLNLDYVNNIELIIYNYCKYFFKKIIIIIDSFFDLYEGRQDKIRVLKLK